MPTLQPLAVAAILRGVPLYTIRSGYTLGVAEGGVAVF